MQETGRGERFRKKRGEKKRAKEKKIEKNTERVGELGKPIRCFVRLCEGDRESNRRWKGRVKNRGG